MSASKQSTASAECRGAFSPRRRQALQLAAVAIAIGVANHVSPGRRRRRCSGALAGSRWDATAAIPSSSRIVSAPCRHRRRAWRQGAGGRGHGAFRRGRHQRRAGIHATGIALSARAQLRTRRRFLLCGLRPDGGREQPYHSLDDVLKAAAVRPGAVSHICVGGPLGRLHVAQELSVRAIR